jgi:hypothetical protein
MPCIKHIKCSLFSFTHVLYCNLLFIYRAQKWAERVGRKCTMVEAVLLHHNFLCRDHFMSTDFMMPEGICLKKSAVPRALDLT